MASETLPGQSVGSSESRPRAGFLHTRAGRQLRENLTAYMFIAPSMIILFIFGIFPIFFAAYVSLYKWRIRQNEYRGLDNYVNSMGDLAWIFFFAIAAALIYIGFSNGWSALQEARERNVPTGSAMLSLIPAGIVTVGGAMMLLRYITFFAQDDAIEAGEASVLGSVWVGLGLIVLGLVLNNFIMRSQRSAAGLSSTAFLPNYMTGGFTMMAAVGMGSVIGIFALRELLASENVGASFGRIQSTIFGLLLFIIAWYVWRWGAQQADNRKLAASVIAGAAFIGAGYFFMTRWSYLTEGASKDFLLSLGVTIWYSVLTVPLQLGISMGLAYLLYQNIKAKGLFRVIFFIPYIAPTVATAGIFQVLFTLRPAGVANSFVGSLGGAPLKWLQESAAVASGFGESFGIAGAENWEIGGPSIALFVIIMFNIWVFVGYDTVIFLAGLGTIPNTLYEAAKIDGAGRWEIFRHITFPLLSPTTYFLSVISIIGTFKAFNHIYVLRHPAAQGTADTASVHFFDTFLRQSRFGYSTGMAIVMFVIILILYLIQQRVAAKKVFYG